MTRPRRGAGASRGGAPEATATVKAQTPSLGGLADPSTLSVLVVESGKTNLKRAEEVVRSLGYRVLPIESVNDALRLVAGDPRPELVIAGLPGGEALVRAIRDGAGDRATLLVAVSGASAEAAERCQDLRADGFIVRPYKRDALGAILRMGAALHAERQRVLRLEADLSAERSRLLRHGETDPDTGFPHFEFFKRLLVLELKRARRYGYSLAVCLAAMDTARLPGASAAALKTAHVNLARRLRATIRDIDLPVDYADGRFLVFLPYTDLTGAERVGRRLEQAVRGEGIITVSVGISALKPGRVVSFARLIRDASMALRAAQLKGGGRVVAKE